MYMRILVALWLIAAIAVEARAQSDATAPSGAPPSIAALQEELRQAGFDPGPVNGVMSEKTTRALIAYERRMRRMPQAIASVGVDAADPVLRAQKELKRLGFYSGPADGALGPGTRDAIIRFEVSRHLPVDPRVSDRLLAALAQENAATASTAPALPPARGAPPARATPPSRTRRDADACPTGRHRFGGRARRASGARPPSL